MDHGDLWRDGAKIIGGGLGTFVGALLVRLGWKRGRDRGRSELPPESQPRLLTRGEVHDLKDEINRLTWKLEQLQRDMGRIEGKTDADHDRLHSAIDDLSRVQAQLETVREHCDHCPTHGPTIGPRRLG